MAVKDHVLCFQRKKTVWNIETAPHHIGYGMYPFSMEYTNGEGEPVISAIRRRQRVFTTAHTFYTPWERHPGIADPFKVHEKLKLVAWCSRKHRVYFQVKGSDFWVQEIAPPSQLLKLVQTYKPRTAFDIYQA